MEVVPICVFLWVVIGTSVDVLALVDSLYMKMGILVVVNCMMFYEQ